MPENFALPCKRSCGCTVVHPRLTSQCRVDSLFNYFNFCWQATQAWLFPPSRIGRGRSKSKSLFSSFYTAVLLILHLLPTAYAPCSTTLQGHYCSQGNDRACPGGTWSTTISKFTALEDCNPCPIGNSCEPGSLTWTTCSSGRYAGVEGLLICTSCEPGTHMPSTGATSCIACEGGSFCPASSSTPIPCPGGSFANATDLGSAGDCANCPSGSSCPTGSLVPELCPAGRFSAQSGNARCSACLEGTHQPLDNQTTCVSCIAGSYCPSASAAPLVRLPTSRGHIPSMRSPQSMRRPMAQALVGGGEWGWGGVG